MIKADAQTGVKVWAQETAEERVRLLLPLVGPLSALPVSSSLPSGRKLQWKLW